MVSILGFSKDAYAKESTQINENKYDFKNIVALDDMSQKELYETATDDFEYVVIYDNLQKFLTDLNYGLVSAENYYFYQYTELPF